MLLDIIPVNIIDVMAKNDLLAVIFSRFYSVLPQPASAKPPHLS